MKHEGKKSEPKMHRLGRFLSSMPHQILLVRLQEKVLQEIHKKNE